MPLCARWRYAQLMGPGMEQRRNQQQRVKGTRRRARHLLEVLESRELLSAGGAEGAGVDVALLDNTLPDFRTLGAAAAAGKVITFDGRNDSAAKVLGKVATWAGATGAKIRSISILSHGELGKFRLGNEWISTQAQHEKAWRHLRGVLDERAQIYVLGCNVAGEGGDGKLLLEHLATLSGTTVHGSTDVTGNGGNWLLEASSNGTLRGGWRAPLDSARLARWDFSLNPLGGEQRVNTTTTDAQATFAQGAHSAAMD